jgi:hypothetical protein
MSHLGCRVRAKLSIGELGKGQQVAVEGRLETRRWDDDRGGLESDGRVKPRAWRLSLG